MGLFTTGVLRIPNPPKEYDQQYFEQTFRELRQWVTKLISPDLVDVGRTAVSAATASTVLVELSGGLYLADTTSNPITITLPNPALTLGYTYSVKLISAGSNALTINAAAGNIDGGATAVITLQYLSLTFRSDGANYWIV